MHSMECEAVCERCLHNASNDGPPALVCAISITAHEWMN